MPLRRGLSSARKVGTSTLARAVAASRWCYLAALCLVACGVDDRALMAGIAVAGAGGRPAAQGGSGQRPMTAGGEGGAGEDVSIPRCDYTQGITPDCATLAQNPGFDSDVKNWDPEGGVFGLWRDLDASGSGSAAVGAVASGSIDVLNTLAGTDVGLAPGSARQCLPATPSRVYDLAGDIYIEEGQGEGAMPGAPYEGSAVLGAFFFDDAECNGTSVGFINSLPVTKVGEWTHVTATGIAPELAQAISVRLNTLKPIRQYTFKATFDNVFVRER